MPDFFPADSEMVYTGNYFTDSEEWEELDQGDERVFDAGDEVMVSCNTA